MESLNSLKQPKSGLLESEFISPQLCNNAYFDQKESISDESFESTDESDADFDSSDYIGLSKHDEFYSSEVVWAKRTLLPWFPAIIINPRELTKETHEIIKRIGSKLPSVEKLGLENKEISNAEVYHLVLFFNKRKTWMYMPENKLRPFRKENDDLFLKKAEYFSSRYKKQLKKAYDKAKKFAYKPILNDHHRTIQQLFLKMSLSSK